MSHRYVQQVPAVAIPPSIRVCADCGAVVVDFDAHDAWHAALTPSLLADHQE